jgi:hypothetical protein
MERVEEFYRFMRARESIRLLRETDAPWPWTDDPILQKFKFTNVKREHDRTSRLLKEEFYDQHRDNHAQIQLLNCALFRYFGTIEFARAVGWQKDFQPDFLKETARKRLAAGDRVFTGAYVITNQGIKAPKQDVVVDIFLAGLWGNAGTISHSRYGQRWRDTMQELQKLLGFGGTGFMAKEVMLDTMMTSFWPDGVIQDRNSWCPAGPGARRGINRLLGRDLKSPMSGDAALPYMLELFHARHDYWPKDWVELELHDIQFQLCEFDKYERVRLGQGRPRSKYRLAP